MKKNTPLTLVEIIVIGGILLAFIYPLFSSSEEEESTLLNKIIDGQLNTSLKNNV
ncbi:hypothetical protein PCC7424_5160 [Gloeothece citriformis PCC 7424]|uniref:Uncharacterized protein n=1 Tax=Gloeothece citriformis (strain PCC 7424) TaxID=65393 RepID=B7KH23_GLOC7|nr:hypothetical protein [Gloeothece citriformis]ACK73510.1 hypothetical protein PCC7424_5160 [Gloeothece citriformis PCC 7424]